MSSKKIKRIAPIKKALPDQVSPKAVLMSKLFLEREKQKQNDALFFGTEIATGKIDPYRLDNYKYKQEIAASLKWSVGRVNKAIKESKVEEVMKQEREEKNAN